MNPEDDRVLVIFRIEIGQGRVTEVGGVPELSACEVQRQDDEAGDDKGINQIIL